MDVGYRMRNSQIVLFFDFNYSATSLWKLFNYLKNLKGFCCLIKFCVNRGKFEIN